MSKVSIQEVKAALRDPEFRRKLPPELQPDVQKYEQNPSCACNLPIYRKLLKYASIQLREYYPGRDIANPDEEVIKMADNHWKVISCHKDELETKLKTLPPGRKQIAVARYEDQVTVVINELDVVF